MTRITKTYTNRESMNTDKATQHNLGFQPISTTLINEKFSVVYVSGTDIKTIILRNLTQREFSQEISSQWGVKIS